MKGLNIFIIALASFTGASAAVTGIGGKYAPAKSMSFDNAVYKSVASASDRVQAISRGTDMITEPEGDSRNYTLQSTHFMDTAFGLIYTEGNYASEIVWNGDKVYIRDIISGLKTDVYVEGTYADGKIRVDLPQICYSEFVEMADEESVGETYYFSANVMEYYEYQRDGTTYMSYRNVAENLDYLIYDVDETTGRITLNLNQPMDPEEDLTAPQYIIGICIDTTPGEDDWFGFGDAYQEYSEFGESVVEVPEHVEFEKWIVATTSYYGHADVGFDGNDVYIANFASMFDEPIVIKGKIDGDKAYFDCPQYLGEVMGMHMYFMSCLWDSEDFIDYVELDQVVMDYDAEKKELAVNNPLIDLLITSGTEEYDVMDYLENPAFRYQNDDDCNAAPQDPEVVYFDDYAYRSFINDYEGYIEWNIPALNVNGYLLDTECMYYHFLINGEVMTFTTDVYPEIDQDYTDVPYEYTEGWDIQVLDESHYITFKTADYQSFGLQSFYIGTDDVIYSSNLVTYIPESCGIESLENNDKAIKSVEFFNLQGQRVDHAMRGVLIMRSTLNDGTVVTRKIVR